MILLITWIKLQYVSLGWKQKKQNTKYRGKQTYKEQTNKQTGLVTRENYQTQYLRSANMTAKEVGVQKEDKNRKLVWGGVGGTWEPGEKQSEHLRQELKTNSIKRSRSWNQAIAFETMKLFHNYSILPLANVFTQWISTIILLTFCSPFSIMLPLSCCC